MIKEMYDEPIMEIVTFDEEDIITTSPVDIPSDDPNQLIPFK